MKTPTIFIAIFQNKDNTYQGFGLCEDGYILSNHTSSSERWLLHDLGVTSNWKHKQYKEHCGNKFNLQVVKHYGMTPIDENYMKAYLLNQKLFNSGVAGLSIL